jgi:glycerophosphoryl diester phosphodiesterase
MIVEKLQDWASHAADLLCNIRQHPEGTSPRPKIIAHRGAWDRQDHIENTLKAFHRARALGAWAIELDIHFTRDNVPVVHHDPHLQRCHNHPGVLGDLQLRELRSAVPAVPTLEEVLSLSGLHFMLEVKTVLTTEQISILNRHLAKLRPIENYHLLTLKPELVRESSALPLPAWILVGDVNLKSLTQKSLERNLGGVAGHYLFMTNSLISRLREHGQKAGVGFLPTKNLYNREWARGVDWVFTNHLPALF